MTINMTINMTMIFMWQTEIGGNSAFPGTSWCDVFHLKLFWQFDVVYKYSLAGHCWVKFLDSPEYAKSKFSDCSCTVSVCLIACATNTE